MTQTSAPALLDPERPESWAERPFEVLFGLSRSEVEPLQRQALARRFEMLRPVLSALEKLAARQGVEQVTGIEDAAPVFFDHRVYKSYPLNLIEKRLFGRLTAWLQRLTAHDLSTMPLDGLSSLDSWLSRLDEHGMIMVHSTGTTGKLSFIPRSRAEWPAWKAAYFEMRRASMGVDTLKEALPCFSTGYRSGHHSAAKGESLFAQEQAGGEGVRYVLYDYALSSDLLCLAGRLHVAEERGELDRLEIDPQILEERKQLIERGRHRDEDLRRWFAKLAGDFRGQRVRISGPYGDLLRIAIQGKEKGIECEFAPDSIIFTGAGLKGFKDAPADWERLIKDFFGIDRFCSMYGMSEIMGLAPLCRDGYYHFFPYSVPVLINGEGTVLPREGVQTGRLGVFDLLAQSYWGGFMSGDRVTVYWDEDCRCGWKGPRVDRNIARFADLEGGDDKITCAGAVQAYGEFMEYVSTI
jgi:hypothetical protein